MNELQAVLDALAAERTAGRAAVLATVVGVSGSGYRRPGARMAVLEGGRRLGSVSGGCLEADICRRGWWLTESGPAVVAYDTAGDDADEGVGSPYRLGCGGTVRVLVERVEPGPEPGDWSDLRERLARGEAAAVVTVTAARGAFPAAVGARWVVAADGRGAAGPTAPGLPAAVRADALQALRDGRSRAAAYAAGGGRGEVLIEVVRPPTRLAVFGSGPDVAPVVRFAKQLGWRVTVADRRPPAALAGRFPDADVVLSVDPADPGAPALVPFDAGVVMTHSYPDDLAWLRLVLAAAVPRYVGVLGARHRTERLVRDLRGGGVDAAGRLFGPVGLDIGADAPAEIALAVVAEVRAVLAGRAGGHLRDRARPVHDLLPGPDPAPVIPGRGRAACAVSGDDS